ncbi:MAG: FAD-binding domain-containing protein [bacterium]
MEIDWKNENRLEAADRLAHALTGLYAGEPTPASHIGGRSQGLRRLERFDVARYEERRNDVGADSGASLLSPYLRHGCITLREARKVATAKIGARKAVKFIQELAWRQFWQLQWERYGDEITADMEEPKIPLGYRTELPMEITAASTGLNCMDISLQQLYQTGYMYNHARMWFAAYLTHHRKITWQTGAKLFYRFLLDGDPASNNLSWQWVASTFSHKPYFFNRSNVEKFSRDSRTGTTYCTHCEAARSNTCPFDASYEQLGKRLFGDEYEHENRGGRRPDATGNMATRRSPFRK